MSAKEVTDRFESFGSSCEVYVIGAGREGSAEDAAALVRRKLLAWHDRFSRFLPDSELSRLNHDPRREVPVSALMARFAQTVHEAGSLTGGLVDATLVDQIESAGYTKDIHHSPPLAQARHRQHACSLAARAGEFGKLDGSASARRQARQRRPGEGTFR